MFNSKKSLSSGVNNLPQQVFIIQEQFRGPGNILELDYNLLDIRKETTESK